MHYSVLLFTIFLTSILCNAVEISSKLDFDDFESTSKISNPNVSFEKLQTSDSNKYLEISCENAKCTKTDTSETKSDSIQTDVVVHIKANIDLNNKTKNFLDDTPDIPVVTGKPDRDHNSFTTRKYQAGETHPVYQYFVSDSLDKAVYPTQPKINIDSLLLNTKEPTINSYKFNEVQYHIPRFESSYHNHYFGETIPQVLWYPKSNRNKNIYKSFWPITTPRPFIRPESSSLRRNKMATGLEWYPNQKTHNVDAGSAINDKLGQLN